MHVVQSFFRFTTTRGATVLVSSLEGATDSDVIVQSAADGVIRLGRRGHLRSLEVMKMRGSQVSGCRHPMQITQAGLAIFPETA